MKIDIKISKKPINYEKAISYLENRLVKVYNNKANELIWILEHPKTFTGGSNYLETEILDKSIKLIKSSRGGKITYHGPGQLICYFVINLNRRKKDIRFFIQLIQNILTETLREFNINSFLDKKNIGIWVKEKGKIKKVAAIGLRIKKWIAFHGFSLNLNVDLKNYDKIIPCGIKDKDITNLYNLKKISRGKLIKKLTMKMIKYFGS